MDIGIIGGGAIGLLFASYLHKEHKVTVYTRTDEQAQVLNREGLFIKSGELTKRAHVRARLLQPFGMEEHELLIVAVKQYHLEGIMPVLKGNHSPLLFLQNGMGHIRYLKQLSVKQDIFLGVVEHGALKQDANFVCHTGIGVTKIASYSGNLNILSGLAQPDFSFLFMEDYEEMLKNKLIVNGVVNPLTAVLSVKNGDLLTNPFYYSLFLQLFDELASVLDFPDKGLARKHVEEVCKRTADNRSSMLRDLENGRVTEIDAILKYVIELAGVKNMDIPLSLSLYTIVKGKEFIRTEA